jgi:flagellar assembly protein FliH
VKIGTPKHIKSNAPEIKKFEQPKPVEGSLKEDLEEEANSIVDDAKEMYLRIIEEANLEAHKILEIAQHERESIYAHATEQGYSDGHGAGFSEGLNQAEAIIQKAAEVKLLLDEKRLEMYREAEIEIMEMVLDIARKVIGEELTQNPDIMLSLIRQALDKCAYKDKLAIRVSELDYSYVNDNKDRIIMLTQGINELEIICDKALQKGSCIVETPGGEVNSGLTVQINEIEKAFEYLLRNE